MGSRVVSLSACCAVALGLSAPDAQADYVDAPFGLRVLLALDRQSNYGSTLGRQASVAWLEGGSANPAVAALVVREGSASPVTASIVDSPTDGGFNIVAVPVSARWPVARGSAFTAYAYTDTPTHIGDDRSDRGLRSHELSFGYSAPVSGRMAFGSTLRLTAARLWNQETAPGLPFAVPVHVVTDIGAVDASFGVVWRPTDRASAGLVAGAAWADTATKVSNLVPLPIPGTGFVLPPGNQLDYVRDTVRTGIVRGGVSMRVTESLTMGADATWLRVVSHAGPSASNARLSLGAEYATDSGWQLRGGITGDVGHELTWSAGVGHRLFASGDLQFGVQVNAAPETNPELGHTRLYVASASWRL